MIKLKMFVMSLSFMLLGLQLMNAQNNETKILAVVNNADWCHICQENKAKVENDVLPVLESNNEVVIISNNLSNDETKMNSQKELMQNGLKDFNTKNSGVIYFVDANTHEILSKSSVANSSKKILKEFNKAYKKASMSPPMHGEKGHVCTDACMAEM